MKETSDISNRWVIIVSFGLSAVFAYLAVAKIDWHETVTVMKGTIWFPFIIISILSYLAGHIVRGLRLKVLVGPDSKLSVYTASNIVVSGYAVNNILPLRLGEFVRTGFLSERTGLSYARSLGITFLERLWDGIAILAIFLLVGPDLAWARPVISSATLILAIALSSVLLAMLVPRQLATAVSAITSPLPAGAHHMSVRLTTQLIDGLDSIRSTRQCIAVILLSLLVWLLEGGLYLFCLPMFGFALSATIALTVMAVTNLGILIPSSPGFVGSFHYFCMFALISFGIPEATALGYAIITHLAFYVPVTIWGLAAMAWYGMQIGSSYALARKASQLPREDGWVVLGRFKRKGRDDLPPVEFWTKLVEAIVPADITLSDEQKRHEVLSSVPSFLVMELRELPVKLRLLLNCGLLVFNTYVIITTFNTFTNLPLSRRKSIVKEWAWGRVPIFRQFFRPIRSLALFAFFDHPHVRAEMAGTKNSLRQVGPKPAEENDD